MPSQQASQQQPAASQSEEPTGVWLPLSHTAESITGQVILSSAGITIAGTTYSLKMERSLGPVEVQSLAQAFSLSSGYQGVDARLYQTSVLPLLFCSTTTRSVAQSQRAGSLLSGSHRARSPNST
jgi:hypothetical protein